MRKATSVCVVAQRFQPVAEDWQDACSTTKALRSLCPFVAIKTLRVVG